MYIVKTTGSQVPFYLSNFGNFTAHSSEAKTFESMEDAKKTIKDNGTYQILDAKTLKFVSWINW